MRNAEITRKTKETDITAQLTVDGTGAADVTTPIGFFTHMLESFSRHGAFDFTLHGTGDLAVDQHHFIEDAGIVIGSAFASALGEKRGIARAGYFVYPMDEALAVVAVDLSGRSYLQYDVSFVRRFVGDMDSDVLHDFFLGVAQGMKANLVVRMPFGRSDHHKMEAIFKAWGRAMRMACARDEQIAGMVPSTKGVIK